MQRFRVLMCLAGSAALVAGGPMLAASTDGASEAPLVAQEAPVAAAEEGAGLSGIVYQPSRLVAKPAPAVLTEEAVQALAASDTPEGAEASELLAEANGADMRPGARANFSDQPPPVIGEMQGLARRSCERAGGAFKVGGAGVFTCD